MQNQSSHWLTIRKEKPDWVIMWGWGAMNPTAIKEAAKTRFPLDRFIELVVRAHVDTEALVQKLKGILHQALQQQALTFLQYKT